jgi:DNA-binding protein H-NS
MRIQDLDTMQFDELWTIHEELTKLLSDRIVAEKRELEQRLAILNRVDTRGNPRSTSDRAPRRKYPKVLPKYCNPLSPSETWSGRGKNHGGWLQPSTPVTNWMSLKSMRREWASKI